VQSGEGSNGGGVAKARLQLVVLEDGEIRTLDLPPEGTLAIGRADGSAVRIDDRAVSRSHALLHVGAKLVIEDLGSANGTLVRDRAGPAQAGDTLNVRQLVGRTAELAVGDALQFGTATVVVRHAPSEDVPDFGALGAGVVVRDPVLRVVYEQAARIAPTPIDILLLGETGVGKEVLARAIHARSARARGPFVGVNCAAFSESLIDSELFGHERGAFTNAMQARSGLFEAAAGGTVLLDEVGDLAPATQAKLLRVLEERVVTRLGANRPRPIDVRIIAATNRDLEADTRAGRFRADLYFRLAKVSLAIPPLRERRSEIDHLARLLLGAACRLIERSEVPRLSADVLNLFARHRWNGNVRELKNAMEHAAALCPGDTILPEHLPKSLRDGVAAAIAPTMRADLPAAADLPGEIRALERARIVDSLANHRTQGEAANALGISRRTLISRMEAFGLPRPRKRDDRDL
jgi:two-component system, NtrC family, response regulator AtoC